MGRSLKRDTQSVEPFTWFGRMFDDWPAIFPLHWGDHWPRSARHQEPSIDEPDCDADILAVRARTVVRPTSSRGKRTATKALFPSSDTVFERFDHRATG
jgi:hypothetical protein